MLERISRALGAGRIPYCQIKVYLPHKAGGLLTPVGYTKGSGCLGFFRLEPLAQHQHQHQDQPFHRVMVRSLDYSRIDYSGSPRLCFSFDFMAPYSNDASQLLQSVAIYRFFVGSGYSWSVGFAAAPL